MIYRHGDRSYAIGMAWSDFVGRAEARAHLRTARRPGLLADVSGDPQGGVAVGIAAEGTLRGRVASGAMAIGRLFGNAVIRQSLADGRVWVARLAAGAPCAGRDEIVSPDAVAARLAEPAQPGATLIGDIDGAALSVDEALALYEAQVADGRIDRAQARGHLLQPAPSLMRPLAVTAVLLLLLCLVATGLWTWRDRLRDARGRQAAFEQLTVSRAQAQRREAERQQKLDAFRRTVDERRLALARLQEDPRDQWSVWDLARRRLPLSVNGYVADAMDCDRAQCTIQWKAAGPRVRLVDQAALPGWVDGGPLTPSPRSTLRLAAAGQGNDVEQGASADSLQHALAQALQFEGGAAGIGAARPDTVPPPGQSGLSPVVVGMTGELRLAASGPAALVRAGDAVRALRGLPVRLDSARWSQLATGPSVTLDGRWIYVND